jgi:predicted AlkP superfamily phosphohydrolase/phosphomutase/tetratricopeptide (TPR) repeat protein
MVLGLDGMDPRVVDLLMSEGKLPNFARLRQEGAYGRLLSSQPMLSPILWTTMATGKPPDQHGIGHFVAVTHGGEQLPVTSQMRKVKALWNILSDAGKKVGVVGWWASWPAETVKGALVSDHTCYHFLLNPPTREAANTQGLTYPPELFKKITPLLRCPDQVTPQEAAAFIKVTPEELSRPFDFKDDVSHFKWAYSTAESYSRVGLQLWKDERPDVLMVYIEATDSTAHLFGHLFRAGPLAGELLEQQKKFGGAVEEMYRYADRLVGEYVKAMDGNTTLVVLSDHGFELGQLPDDPSKLRDMRRVSEKYHAIEGIIYLYGRGVKKNVRIDQPRQLDVAPTLLALAGMPTAQDMPGRVLNDALTIPVPGPAVASYEGGPARAGDPKTAKVDPANPQIVERLRSLGYLGDAPPTPGQPGQPGTPGPSGVPGAAAAPSAPRGPGGPMAGAVPGTPPPAGRGGGPGLRSPQGERNLAAMLFESGRLRESAEAYAKLVRENPKDGSLHASYGGVLGALGRYDEALEQLNLAVKLEPLNVEAYHNRGALLERQGKRDAAVQEYRTAVRYNPQYEPSRNALRRLGVAVESSAPRSEAEKKAGGLAERAAQAARRGNYAEAMKHLDEAERIAPRYVIVHQYRANVAYLMGNRQAAIRALEKALAIEPDNALFKANLARLKEAPKPGS